MVTVKKKKKNKKLHLALKKEVIVTTQTISEMIKAINKAREEKNCNHDSTQPICSRLLLDA